MTGRAFTSVLHETSAAERPGAVMETVAAGEPASPYEVRYDALFPGTFAEPVFFQTNELPVGAEAFHETVSPVKTEGLSALQEREGGAIETEAVSVTSPPTTPCAFTAGGAASQTTL